MKIIFFGDSITDMGRDRERDDLPFSYGEGYPFFVAGELYCKDAKKYEIINRGISGNRVVDLYARIKKDVWNENPNVLSILIGINDVWHELGDGHNGVDIVRYERVYRMLIEDTLKRLPNLKIILCEPFVLKGTATEEKFKEFLQIKEYAKVVKNIAKDYNLFFLPLQDELEKKTKEQLPDTYLFDGVHPNVAGAKLIADEWLKLFYGKVDK